MKKLFIALLALMIFGCNATDNPTTSSAPGEQQTENAESFPVKELLIDKGDEEGWGADIRLSIVSTAASDTSNLVTAISTYQGKRVGLLVAIPKKNEGSIQFGNGMTFKSIGPESDQLLKVLATLYKQKVDSTVKFTKARSVTAVNLGEYIKGLGEKDGAQYQAANQYKLFYQGKKDEDYAELYFNINVTEHWIEIKEKDEEYRPMIIKLLSQ